MRSFILSFLVLQFLSQSAQALTLAEWSRSRILPTVTQAKYDAFVAGSLERFDETTETNRLDPFTFDAGESIAVASFNPTSTRRLGVISTDRSAVSQAEIIGPFSGWFDGSWDADVGRIPGGTDAVATRASKGLQMAFELQGIGPEERLLLYLENFDANSEVRFSANATAVRVLENYSSDSIQFRDVFGEEVQSGEFTSGRNGEGFEFLPLGRSVVGTFKHENTAITFDENGKRILEKFNGEGDLILEFDNFRSVNFSFLESDAGNGIFITAAVPEPGSIFVMGGLFALCGTIAWWRNRK